MAEYSAVYKMGIGDCIQFGQEILILILIKDHQAVCEALEAGDVPLGAVTLCQQTTGDSSNWIKRFHNVVKCV